MGYAKPTQARLIDQRARRRATQALIEKHREDFTALYEQHRRAAESEAAALTECAATVHPSSEPPRLMTGARKAGQEAVDRIDVARCPHCVKHHDRNHVCTHCGAQPGQRRPKVSASDVAEDVEFLLETSPLMTVQQIADRLRFSDRSGVQVALKRAGRQDLLERLVRNTEIAGQPTPRSRAARESQKASA